MYKFRKTAALLLALSLSFGLAACGGTGGKSPGSSGAPDSASKSPFSSVPPVEPNEEFEPTGGADAPMFDINAYEYSELKDIGTKHIPIYPAVLHGGTVAKPYGTVESKEVGYTGEMEEVGSSPQSYNVYWAVNSEQRLEDIPVSNADGLLMTLSSNIDAAHIFPFDVQAYLGGKTSDEEILQAYKDSITAYADFVDKCGEYYSSSTIADDLRMLAGFEDLDKYDVGQILNWCIYLVYDVFSVDFVPPDNVEPGQYTGSSILYSILLSVVVDDIPDSLENIGPLKRLIKSLDPVVVASIMTGNDYIYFDRFLEAFVGRSGEEGVDYILSEVTFRLLDDITFGGKTISTVDDAVRVFGTPTEAWLGWGPDTESSDTATAYLPYSTYIWNYAHVRITMKLEAAVSGDMALLIPSTLNIKCN